MTISTTEKLARYETAQETIGVLIAIRSKWIYEEEQKPEPNQDLIKQWRAEKHQFQYELDELLIDDDEKIETILNEYAPIVKAYMAS
ncbi:hypothetical protein [Zooshikella ganghwensis]|uniref:Uncharacterized protein n=1 Tax=Zooshikella ganghwensis TaxID=202772 RepID=A0A4P9VFD6_9GAMM|nr:hypothetical protein [Zooshikella ganghwensis]RDH41815.1 hypothetical protein B9G39_26690 [Zooshikella ganghwensis]RDH41847.1 hypothetical protein B9G39_25830 [Zooshikella ganghwensis]